MSTRRESFGVGSGCDGDGDAWSRDEVEYCAVTGNREDARARIDRTVAVGDAAVLATATEAVTAERGGKLQAAAAVTPRRGNMTVAYRRDEGLDRRGFGEWGLVSVCTAHNQSICLIQNARGRSAITKRQSPTTGSYFVHSLQDTAATTRHMVGLLLTIY